MHKDFKFLPSITLNGVVYYDYQSLMMLLRLSLHVNAYQRRRRKYHAQFAEVNGRMYVSAAYARLVADFKALGEKRKEVSHV